MRKRTRLVTVVLVMALVLTMSGTSLASRVTSTTRTVYYRSDLKIFVDGRQVTLDIEPFIVDPGWIMVPIEFLSKELGVNVTWDDATSTFTLTTTDRANLANVPPAKDIVLSETEGTKAVVSQVADSVVLIQTYDSSGQGKSLGSGVVIGKDLVITNFHLVDGASAVSITDSAGGLHECPGYAGFDELNDLALLHCETGLKPVVLEDPDAVEVGDAVVAIGNPQGLQGTVSTGIVSGLRRLDGKAFVQTTAPISPGSSDGGLFAMNGKLVGITTLMWKDGQNLNMAVPSNQVRSLTQNAQEITPFASESNEFVEVLSLGETAAVLNRTSWQLRLGDRLVPVNYIAANDAILVIMRTLAYTAWVNSSPTVRNGLLLDALLKAREVSSRKAMKIVAFYCDYWPVYPIGFPQNEISLTIDGRSWIVTHFIGDLEISEDGLLGGTFSCP